MWLARRLSKISTPNRPEYILTPWWGITWNNALLKQTISRIFVWFCWFHLVVTLLTWKSRDISWQINQRLEFDWRLFKFLIWWVQITIIPNNLDQLVENLLGKSRTRGKEAKYCFIWQMSSATNRRMGIMINDTAKAFGFGLKEDVE